MVLEAFNQNEIVRIPKASKIFFIRLDGKIKFVIAIGVRNLSVDDWYFQEPLSLNIGFHDTWKMVNLRTRSRSQFKNKTEMISDPEHRRQ